MQMQIDKLDALLRRDIEIIQMTKELALIELKSKSSLFHRHLFSDYKIKLVITFDGELVQKKSDIQVKEAIKIVKAENDDNKRFNITFIDANKERAETFRNGVFLNGSKLSLEFSEIDRQNVQTMLDVFEAKWLDLKIWVEVNENHLQTLERLNITEVVLTSRPTSNLAEFIYLEKAREKVKSCQEKYLSLAVEKITRMQAVKIIEDYPNAKFNIKFIGVSWSSRLVDLEPDCAVVSFNKLDPTEAKEFIDIFRKENVDFSLCIEDLDYKQANDVIQKASLDPENIKISKVRKLEELYMNELRPKQDLLEFALRGIEYLIDINEKQFIPWRCIMSLGTLGVVEMAMGYVLMSTAFGVLLGRGLVTEGVADLFYISRITYVRNFKWKDYVKQKAVSLALSAVSIGWNSIKGAGKGVQNLANNAWQEIIEQGGNNVVINGKSIGQTLRSASKSLRSVAFKQTGTLLCEGAAREGLNWIAGSLSSLALNQFKPSISRSIQQKVEIRFFGSRLKKIVHKIHTLDRIKRTRSLKDKISKIALEAINPDCNVLSKQWDTIGAPLCKGILGNSGMLGSSSSMLIRVLGNLEGLWEINTLLDKIHENIVKKLEQLDKHSLSLPNLFNEYCEIEKKDARRIAEVIKSKYNYDESGYNWLELLTAAMDVDFQDLSQHKPKVIDFLITFDEYSQEVDENDLSQIMKCVSDLVSDQLIRIIESQLISPWSTCGVGWLTGVVSSKIQNKVIQKDLTEKEQRIRSELQELENKENKTSEEWNKLKGYQNELFDVESLRKNNLTYSDLMYHETKKFTIAQSQCEIIYYAKQQKENNQDKNYEEARKYAAEVEKGKPASLYEMFIMASQNNIDVIIVDDADYRLTEEDKAKGTRIIVFNQGNADTNGIGHYQILGEDARCLDVPSQGNDCGYAVISEILRLKGISKSVTELRQQVREAIIERFDNFSQIIKAERWIKDHYPQEANHVLFTGAGKIGDIVERFVNLDQPTKQIIKRIADKARITIEDAILYFFTSDPRFRDHLIDTVSNIVDGRESENNEVETRDFSFFLTAITSRLENVQQRLRNIIGEERYTTLLEYVFQPVQNCANFVSQYNTEIELVLKIVWGDEIAAKFKTRYLPYIDKISVKHSTHLSYNAQ